MPEDLQEQLKAVLKSVKKAQPNAIPDKRKRDEIHRTALVRTVEHIASQYSTGIVEDEVLLKSGNLTQRARMAVEVRLGEKRLLREALERMSEGEDVEMADGDEALHKRAKK